MSAAEIGPVTLAELLTPVSRETLIAAGMHPLKATLAADFDARAVDAAKVEHDAYCDGWACAACNAPDDIPPEHAISAAVVLPPAAYEAVVELVNNPPPPTPALVACMAPPEEREPVTLAEAVAMTNLLRDALGERCRHTAPDPFAQAGAQCEREPHATGNHTVSARDGHPGAVWSDARSREDGGS